jgi:hypothetical protein
LRNRSEFSRNRNNDHVAGIARECLTDDGHLRCHVLNAELVESKAAKIGSVCGIVERGWRCDLPFVDRNKSE